MSNTGLSDRELEILRFIASGMSYREISYTLNISYNTVSRHAQNIMRSLGVWTVTSALAVVVRDGDIDLDKLNILRRK